MSFVRSKALRRATAPRDVSTRTVTPTFQFDPLQAASTKPTATIAGSRRLSRARRAALNIVCGFASDKRPRFLCHGQQLRWISKTVWPGSENNARSGSACFWRQFLARTGHTSPHARQSPSSHSATHLPMRLGESRSAIRCLMLSAIMAIHRLRFEWIPSKHVTAEREGVRVMRCNLQDWFWLTRWRKISAFRRCRRGGERNQGARKTLEARLGCTGDVSTFDVLECIIEHFMCIVDWLHKQPAQRAIISIVTFLVSLKVPF
jgi:hypothetical protein